jgi:hypothetical protein
MHEHKPKIAVCVPIRNDRVFEHLEIKKPNKNRLENVFVGFMIFDYLKDCVRCGRVWYLFPGDMEDDGITLHNVSPDCYKEVCKSFVTKVCIPHHCWLEHCWLKFSKPL